MSQTSSATTRTGNPSENINISRPMRKSLVHFRRPTGGGYDGSYGFDWLRDEYVYDIERIAESGNVKKKLYKGHIDELKAEYTHLNPKGSILPEVREIRPYDGTTYIPSWLGIFPSTKGVSRPHSLASSNINYNGVNLYLQVDQESLDDNQTLTQDGTEIIFEASPNIIVTPKKLSIDDLILNGVKIKKLGSTKTLKYYADKSLKINIRATGVNRNTGYVKVIAKKGGSSRNVGVLMIYPNSDIPLANIKVIHFCTKAGQQKVKTPSAYQDYLKKRSFNQALVRGEINGEGYLNIIDERKKYIARHINNNKIKIFLKKYPPRVKVPRSKGSDLKEDIVKLYEHFSERYVPDGGIEGRNNKITFVIFTDYQVTDGRYITLGSAMVRERNLFENIACSFKEDCFSMVWGNAVVLFDQGNNNLDTFAHELGHSFSLPHTFASNSFTKHSFYQGYTDNLMDYSYFLDTSGRSSAGRNPYSGHMWALFKWQWDILRQDRSIS